MCVFNIYMYAHQGTQDFKKKKGNKKKWCKSAYSIYMYISLYTYETIFVEKK